MPSSPRFLVNCGSSRPGSRRISASLEVTAEGLTDWTVSSDRRLRLTFDRPFSAPQRRLRVWGWIPLAEDPLQTASREHRLPVPWFRWEGGEEQAGFLTVSSISKLEIQGSAGIALISSESSGTDGTTSPRNRLSYRVDDSRRLGELVWESVPARVSVAIESQITIHPDSADWVAVLRYDVVGGALDAIHLKMPAAWAAKAELQLAGSEYQLTTETRGSSAFWSITPERPIWGSQRFVLRSELSQGADREVVQPEISPLGRGAVDAYVAVVNASGRALSIDNSVGLERIAYGERFRAREFAVHAGAALGAYRVNVEPWVLRVQLARSASETGDSQSGFAALSFADLTVVAMPDRSSVGRAVYETIASSGSVFAFELPPGGELVWATVDSDTAVPLRSDSGTYSIALPDRGPSRVGVIWQMRTRVLAASGVDLARGASQGGPRRGHDSGHGHDAARFRGPRRFRRTGIDHHGPHGDGTSRLAGPHHRRFRGEDRSQLGPGPREAREFAR